MDQIVHELNIESKYFEEFRTVEIEKVVYDKSNREFQVMIHCLEILSFEAFRAFKRALELYLRSKIKIQVTTKKCNLDFRNLESYLNYCIETLNLEALKQVQFQLNGDIKLMCLNKSHLEQVKKDIPLLKNYLLDLGIQLEINALLEEHPLNLEKIKLNQSEIKKKEAQSIQSFKQNYANKNNSNNYGRRKLPAKSEYKLIAIDQLSEAVDKVCIEGEIFLVNVRETRNGSYAVRYGIHNGLGALISFYFENNEENILKEGQCVRVYGNYVYDADFERGYVFRMEQIDKIENLFIRHDVSDKKRVELHLHTNKSDMDGVSDVSEYLKQAFEWKHPGIAITDHAGVQSFPKAYRELKSLRKKYPNQEFKIAYGLEANLVDPHLEIVKNCQQRSLHNGNYVVFDIETTGLSAYFDYMIEFGAVKIINGKVVEKMQTFIQSPVEISSFIQDLTGIGPNELRNAPTIPEALDDILDFIGDHVLVAHNASFDIDFMQEILKKNGKTILKNPVIDTLDLARAMYPERRSYRLGSIARYLNINYDEAIAHRADYDAEVLSLVFLAMLRDPRLIDKTEIQELQKMENDESFSKKYSYHANLLAKNQAGLKKLYELVSLSHTKHLAAFGKGSKSGEEFMAEPRVLREELIKRRSDLFIGAGCPKSEVFEFASNKGQEQLEQVMSFYDYIEIMPLDVYRPLLESHTIPSEKRLMQVIDRIIKTAQKLNIPIVVSGDVHYNHPNDKIARDVYIHSQGIGGTRHPLYIFNEARRLAFVSPKQHFRTTNEMLDDMKFLPKELIQEAVIENPLKILSEIEEVKPVPDELYTPSLDQSDKKLKKIVYNNAHNLYGNPLPKIVENRLDRELNSIIGHGYGVIYYISHLLVKKSLEDGYLVGSRGSVGSSLVATMAEITEVNPLPPHYVCANCHYHEFYLNGEYSSGYDLSPQDCPHCQTSLITEGQDIPFETFLGFEGDKVPDIDLNFSGDYQEFAHAYTKEIFGEKYVYRAGTISTVAQKTAYGYVLGYHESLRKEASNSAWNEYLASRAEGVKRTTGQHPGGIIVIPNHMDVHDFTPIQYPANNKHSPWYTTHFEFHDIDDNVLKLDILGHVDPTAMKQLEEFTNVDIQKIPMNDPATLSLFYSTDALNVDNRKYFEKTGALGLPEFGTPFVRRMLEATKPSKFSDLVRISGLSHGTDVWANNAESLIQQGFTLDEVIGCRDDIMVYLMQNGLEPKTSFDIMESVRRGRGLTEEWILEMKKNNVPDWYIDSCEKIKYMFPKAHAAAYVMMAVRVAWFKVYYPLAYYAVYFTLRVDAYDIEIMTSSAEIIAAELNSIQSRLRDNELKREVSIKEKNLIDTFEVCLEMAHRGYKISKIDLEHSHATRFILDPNDEHAILPPFNVVDGLGNSVANAIVEARETQMFISKEDLSRRAGVSTTLIQRLEKLGVLNNLQDSNQLSLF